MHRIRQISLLIVLACVVAFFVLLTMSDKITGYCVAAYPLVLAIGLLFGGSAMTGRLKDGIKYAGFIIGLALVVILLSLLFRK